MTLSIKYKLIGLLTVLTLLGSQAVQAMPNPASVFCVENGWVEARLTGLTDEVAQEQGSVTYCLLPNGRYYEEWDLFRGADNRYKEVVDESKGKSTLEAIEQENKATLKEGDQS